MGATRLVTPRGSVKRFKHGRFAALLLPALGLVACHNSDSEIRLFVAASLADVAAAWQTDYESTGSLQYHSGASMMLANQILAGAEADLFLAAGAVALQKLEPAGVIARIDSAYLRNRVVIITAPGVAPPTDLAELMSPRFARIAIADPDLAPAGVYARAGLKQAGLWEELQGRFVTTGDVRSALAAVAMGAADAGFVYATDARLEPELTVTEPDPDSPFPSVAYPLVMLAPETPAKVAFWRYLHSPEARAVAERFGFRS
jgi:molybdate transport system substrate-binding protein